MDHRTRMSRIRAAVRAERGRREKRAIAGLSCICAMLCAAVSVLIRQEMGPGDFIVQESYGAVLLRLLYDRTAGFSHGNGFHAALHKTEGEKEETRKRGDGICGKQNA